jgi:hypothetical protein
MLTKDSQSARVFDFILLSELYAEYSLLVVYRRFVESTASTFRWKPGERASRVPLLAGCLIGLLLEPEHGCSMVLRKRQ